VTMKRICKLKPAGMGLIFALMTITMLSSCKTASPELGNKDSGADTDSDSDDTDSESDPSECGNNITEGDEVCDDGNLISGDGCNSTCTLNDEWDYVANTVYDGDQREPSLTCSTDRVFLAFSDWSGTEESGAGVRVRVFGADGMPVNAFGGDDTEIAVNTTTQGNQSRPRVALRPDETIIVVWTDDGQDAVNSLDVRGRLLDPSQSDQEDDFCLSSIQEDDQQNPAVAVDDSGGFLAVWVDNNAGGADVDGYGIKGRLFDADATPRVNSQTADDNAFQINMHTTSNQFQPDVAWLGDRYLVVWADASGDLDTDGYGVVGVLLDENGGVIGPGDDFLINTTITGMQATPRIAVQPGLGAVVVWTDNSLTEDVYYYGIRGRLLDEEGAGRENALTSSDEDFQINTTMSEGQQLPFATAMPDGRFAVSWQDWSAADGSGSGIMGRVFSADADPLNTDLTSQGDDFQINTTFMDAQITPEICSVEEWFFSAWEDNSGSSPDDSGSSVRYRLLPGP
jgi:cysteine-rich repeat protein